MADYNVNMKQWNGTSFDNVLPLAYNAKQLGGQSLAEVKQWVQDNGLLLYTGHYTGTGKYGQNSPTSITFPFKPIILIGPISLNVAGRAINIVEPMKTSYEQHYWFPYQEYLKISADGKTISWYNTSSARDQFNDSGYIYYFAAIGGYDMGGATEWTITSSGTWTVPKTGRYMLELYGKGGDSFNGPGTPASGGASCQHYDSINLVKGDELSISIGSTSVSSTSFGNYSIANAKSASSGKGGEGTGNKGANGTVYTGGADLERTYGSGVLSSKYGYGAGTAPFSNNGGPGAVYLKYLGA